VGKLRQEVLTTPWEVCIERARWYTEVYARNAEQPIEVIRALAFRKTLDETPIQICPGELLVGHRTSKRVGSPLFPEVKPAWIEDRPGSKMSSISSPPASFSSSVPPKKTRPFSGPKSCRSGEEEGRGTASLHWSLPRR
jgi:pyruvate-formate lyase